MIRSGLGRKRKITRVESHAGEWAVQATYWAPQSWGPLLGRWVPLAGGKTTRTNRRAVGNLDLLRRSAHALACPHRWSGGAVAPIFPRQPGCTPQLMQGERAPIYPGSQRDTGSGWPWPGRKLSCGKRRGDLGGAEPGWGSRSHCQSLFNSTSEAAQIFEVADPP